MENQTLQQFKEMQRLEMRDLISKGKLVNSVTGFEYNKSLDQSVIMNDSKKFKKRWEKRLKKE
jgi:hypothetical protein